MRQRSNGRETRVTSDPAIEKTWFRTGMLDAGGEFIVASDRATRLHLFWRRPPSRNQPTGYALIDRIDVFPDQGRVNVGSSSSIRAIIPFGKETAIAMDTARIRLFNFDAEGIKTTARSVIHTGTNWQNSHLLNGKEPGTVALFQNNNSTLRRVDLDLSDSQPGEPHSVDLNQGLHWVNSETLALQSSSARGDEIIFLDSQGRKKSGFQQSDGWFRCGGGFVKRAIPQPATPPQSFARILATLGRECLEPGFELEFPFAYSLFNSIHVDSLARSPDGSRIAVMWSNRSFSEFERKITFNDPRTGRILATAALPQTWVYEGIPVQVEYGPLFFDKAGSKVLITRGRLDEEVLAKAAQLKNFEFGMMAWLGDGSTPRPIDGHIRLVASNSEARQFFFVHDGMVTTHDPEHAELITTDAQSGHVVRRYPLPESQCNGRSSFDPRTGLYVEIDDEVICVSNLWRGKYLGTFVVENNSVSDISFVPGRERLLAVDGKGRLRSIDLPLGEIDLGERAVAEIERLRGL